VNNEDKILELLTLMQQDISEVKQDVSGLKSGQIKLEQGQTKLEQGQTETRKDITKLHEGQVRLEKGQRELANSIENVDYKLGQVWKDVIHIEGNLRKHEWEFHGVEITKSSVE